MKDLHTEESPRVAILGAGALGSLIAARLAHAGVDVLLLSRPSAHVEAVARDGLRLKEADGTGSVLRLRTTTDPASVTAADTLLICVKTWATAEALEPVSPHLRNDALVVTLQNGIGNEGRVATALGRRPDHVGIGVTALGAHRTEPGVVQVGGAGPTLLGYPDRPADPALRQLASLMSDAGMPCAVVGDIERWVWRKLAVNAAINGLTALAGVPNGTVADDPGLRTTAETVAAEVETVALAEGVNIPDAVTAVVEVARATAPNRSSMLQDIEVGRQTEVDAIHLAVVERAARHGLEVPATQAIGALVKARSAAHHARSRGGRLEEHP